MSNMYSIAKLAILREFLSAAQTLALTELAMGVERAFYLDKIDEMVNVVQTMPVTYQQDNLGDEAVVHLHYFRGGADWFITEKDIDGGIDQAFGFAELGFGHGELGYISIRELVANGVELDLHWTAKTLREAKEALYHVA